jgi:hypothetical protein
MIVGRRAALVAALALFDLSLGAQVLEPAHGQRLAGEAEEIDSPPLGSDAIPAVPLPGRAADQQRLDEARSLFVTPPRELRLGPWVLLTDIYDGELLASMARVAEEVEPLYQSRYGLDLAGEAAETIVLYRSEPVYRVLQDRSERIRGLESRGHVGWGLIVLYAGDRASHSGTITVLRHELAHVLNRRGLGPALPPWLDEGLADDFAAHELGAAREPRETPLEAMRTIGDDRIELWGALASLDLLARALAGDETPALESILALDWKSFMVEPQAKLHYAASSWLVRYLLDSRSGLDADFRAFLQQVAHGARAEPGDLVAALRRPWPEVVAGWRVYVAWRAVGAGVGPTAGGVSASASGSSSRQRDSPPA